MRMVAYVLAVATCVVSGCAAGGCAKPPMTSNDVSPEAIALNPPGSTYGITHGIWLGQVVEIRAELLKEIDKCASAIDESRARFAEPDPAIVNRFRLYLSQLNELYDE